jgi:hypothetical protein
VNDSQETASSNLDAWRANLEILIQHLTTADEPENISEALLVLLLQGLGLFGLDSMVMQECFPLLDLLKRRIDLRDYRGALRQAILFRQQLDEVRSLVCSGTASAEQGAHSAQRILFDAEEEP